MEGEIMCKGCDIHRKLSRELHQIYDGVLKDPVPESLSQLLAKLK
jgi:hypothetical protein